MNSKSKGSGGERELEKILTAAGLSAHRNNKMYTGGLENPDISIPGVHVECKRCEKLRLYDAMNQAVDDSNGGDVPVVMHRKNRSPWIVIMLLDDWIKLYKDWRNK